MKPLPIYLCAIAFSLTTALTAQSFDHHIRFPRIIDGQIGGPFSENVSWFSLPERDVFVKFYYDGNQQNLQAEYYPVSDSCFSFRSFWPDGRIQAKGSLQRGPLETWTDTVWHLDEQTYEETVSVDTFQGNALLKEGGWWEYDAQGNVETGQYRNGEKGGSWSRFDTLSIQDAIQHFHKGQLLRDSATNALLSNDLPFIKSMLMGNWALSFNQKQFARTQEDYSNSRLRHDLRAFFQFNADGKMVEHMYVGCKAVGGGIASGVRELRRGTYDLIDAHTLEITLGGKNRRIHLYFLSSECLLWSEGMRP